MIKLRLNKSETVSFALLLKQYLSQDDNYGKNTDLVLLTRFVIDEFFDKRLETLAFPKDQNQFKVTPSVAFSILFMLTNMPLSSTSYELVIANKVISIIQRQLIGVSHFISAS